MWNNILVWLPKHFNCLISPTSTNLDSTLFTTMIQPDPSGQCMNILPTSCIHFCIAWYWIVKEMGTYQKAVWWDLQDSPSQCPPPGSCVKLHQIKANMALLGIFGALSAETFWRSPDLRSRPRGQKYGAFHRTLQAWLACNTKGGDDTRNREIGDKDGRLWRSGDMGQCHEDKGSGQDLRGMEAPNCEWAPTSDACARLFHSLFWQAALWQHCYVPTFASGGTQRDGDMMGVIVEINAASGGYHFK